MAEKASHRIRDRVASHSHAWRYVLQGLCILIIGFFAWTGFHGDINRWVAAAAMILFGALLVTSFVLDARAMRQDLKDITVGEQSLPLADTLLANIPDPIILIDRRMMVFEVNDAAHDLLPTLRKGFPLSFSLRNPDVLGGIDQVLRSGGSVKVHHIEKIPTERAFELQISLLRGTEQWVLLFFRDLTSSRRLEQMRVDFIANVSHELRTPLASVIGFIETLQGPARDDSAARTKFLAVMLEQSRRMTRLIDDLLSLSRIELHVHLPPRNPLDLSNVIREIVTALTPHAKENGASLSLDISDGPFLIDGDRDEMLRVAENLIENAVKYGGDGGNIDIALRAIPAEEGMAAQVELTVRDYGAGIAPEHLPRLTERFYRTDTDASRKKGGTGLGLAIVKHIVARHRGKLQIESEMGKGSLFRVLIPARKESKPSEETLSVSG